MKKLYTLIAALMATASLSAETVTWTVNQIASDYSNNDLLNDATIVINDNLSITLGDGEGTSAVNYRKTTNDQASYITFYSKNTLTVNATDATLNSITFVVDTESEGALTTQPTPGWSVKSGSTTFNAENPTWTGTATSMAFLGNSKTVLLGLTIEYTVDTPSVPGEYQNAKLFFNADQVAQGTAAQTVILQDNGAVIEFTSNSANAQLDASQANYGTVANYITTEYRYRPGGKSSNGVNSTNKAVMTVPCNGTLYIYAYNNQDDVRNLQVNQNNNNVFDENYAADDYVSPEGSTTKIYPVKSVELTKGTAYILWPVNQLMFSGFEFVPEGNSTTAIESVVEETVVKGNGVTYDLNGRVVNDDYKGIVIKDGKKYLRR